MTKKHHTTIDELLEKARNSAETISREEAVSWLSSQKGIPQQHSNLKLKRISIMTTLSAVVLTGLWYLWSGPTTEQNTVKPQHKELYPLENGIHGPDTRLSENAGVPVVSEAGEENRGTGSEQAAEATLNPSPIIAYPAPSLSGPDTPSLDSTLRLKIRRVNTEMNTENNGEGDNVQTISLVMDDGFAELPPCKEEDRAMVPVGDELARIGIVQDGGALLYLQENTRKGEVKLRFQDLFLTGIQYHIDDLKHKFAPKILPVAVTNCRGMLLYPEPGKVTEEEIAAALVVRVENGDGFLLFWFPRNEDVFKLFGEERQKEIREHPERYLADFTLPKPEKNLAVNPILSKEKPVKIQWEPEEQILPLSLYADALGISTSEGSIGMKRKGVKLQMDENSMGVNIANGPDTDEQMEEEKVKRIIPFYVSDDHFFRGGNSMIIKLVGGDGQNDLMEEFAFEKYRLIAFSHEDPILGRYLFWYPLSPALESILSPEHLKIAKEKMSRINPDAYLGSRREHYPNVEAILKEEKPSALALNAVEPGPEALRNMGIVIKNDGHIRVTHLHPAGVMVDDFSKQSSLVIEMKKDSSFSPEQEKNLKAMHSALVYITDDLGNNYRLFNSTGGETDMNKLIPVRVRTGQTYTLYDKINGYWRPDIILWLQATPEVLDLLDLEEDPWTEMEMPRVQDSSETSTPDCRYTEICRNKPGVFSQHKLFPNPAKAYVDLSWESEEATECSVSLYALNGKKVKTFNGLKATEGKNRHHLELGELAPGIYMVILKSGKGDEIHERLVIRQ